MSFFPRDVAAPVAVSGPVIEWEEPDCLLCGSRNARPLLEAPDAIPGGSGLWFAVVQCQECGLCFTSPRPSVDTIGQFYPPLYRPHHPRGTRRPRWRPRWPGSGYHLCSEGQILTRRGEGRLLDFGCGGGSFMARMHHQAWRVTGIDVSTAAIHRIRAELGLRALVGTLPHPELQEASFDVITMWHSLEHVHRPLEVLQEARRLLAPGGQLLIATPNIDSLPFRWFGPDWYCLDLPRHLTHFTPGTLNRMLDRAGFRPGCIHMVRQSHWLRYSAKRAAQNREKNVAALLLGRKTPSCLATWYAYLSRQSDCMMALADR